MHTTQTEHDKSIQAFKTEVENVGASDMLDIKKTSEQTALQKMHTAAGKSGMLLPKNAAETDRLSQKVQTKVKEETKEKTGSDMPEGLDKIEVATD